MRGEAGLEGREWDSFWTRLVAPRSYIGRGHDFQTHVDLEAIIELLAMVDPRRSEFKCQVLHEAIQICVGPQIVDEAMTRFREHHYVFFQEFFHNELSDRSIENLPLPKPVYAGETWFRFRSPRVLPLNAYIHHKAPMGVVDLTFPDTKVEVLKELTPYLEPDMTAVQTSKSAAIRIEVPLISNFCDFDRERGSVEKSFTAIRRFLALYRQQREHFDSVLLRSSAGSPGSRL